jgi:hypothetical protein
MHSASNGQVVPEKFEKRDLEQLNGVCTQLSNSQVVSEK